MNKPIQNPSARCPQCGVQADGRDTVDEYFGFRTMNGQEHVQSWCKRCRSQGPPVFPQGVDRLEDFLARDNGIHWLEHVLRDVAPVAPAIVELLPVPEAMGCMLSLVKGGVYDDILDHLTALDLAAESPWLESIDWESAGWVPPISNDAMVRLVGAMYILARTVESIAYGELMPDPETDPQMN